MLEEKDLNANSLAKAIQTGFMDEAKRLSLKENAYQLGTRNAGQDIVEWGEQIIAGHQSEA